MRLFVGVLTKCLKNAYFQVGFLENGKKIILFASIKIMKKKYIKKFYLVSLLLLYGKKFERLLYNFIFFYFSEKEIFLL